MEKSGHRGKFESFQIKFDKGYLISLTQDEKSRVYQENCEYHIALHPAQLNDIPQSIKDELGRKVAKYDKTFKGILLGYENIKLLSSLGQIGLDNCYIHINIKADFFIFKPEINMVLRGIVTRASTDHVGCLVYNTFNVSLPKFENEDNWLGNEAVMGAEVDFRISFIDFETRLLYIRGQLLAVGNNTEQNSTVNTKIKFELDEDEHNATENSTTDTKIKLEPDEEELIATERVKSKKKKKKRDREETVDEASERRRKRKENKRKQQEIDKSLEDELNLATLFEDTSIDLNKDKRKRRHSLVMDSYLENVKKEPESEVEGVLSPKKKKRKNKDMN